MYPSQSKYARRGVGNLTGERPMPAHPTETKIGTEDRVAVYAERAERGEQLCHPADSKEIGPDVQPGEAGRQNN